MSVPAPESTGGPTPAGLARTAGDFLDLKPASSVYPAVGPVHFS